MEYLYTFERYEIKFLLDPASKRRILDAFDGRMSPDIYGRTVIRNVYYDTPDRRIIRRSLDKPDYKEKLRVRSYSCPSPDDDVFVELKKKYNGIVYKRRLSLPSRAVDEAFRSGGRLPCSSQIASEIEYFRSFYGALQPSVFLTYEREAFFAADGSDLRITFDENILFREKCADITGGIYGEPLLPDDMTLMEVKTSVGIPLWLTEILSERKIYRTPFSKYGEAYIQMNKRQSSGGVCYAR